MDRLRKLISFLMICNDVQLVYDDKFSIVQYAKLNWIERKCRDRAANLHLDTAPHIIGFAAHGRPTCNLGAMA